MYKVRLNVVGDRVPMVQDYAAMYAGVRQFLGMLWQQSAAGFVPTNETIQIPENSPYLGEYLRHLRDGDLIPADARTAKLCGSPTWWMPAAPDSTETTAEDPAKD